MNRPLVGRSEAAKILGVNRNNMHRMKDVPPSLQERGIEGMEVGATPLWYRSEIEEVARMRAKHKGKRW